MFESSYTERIFPASEEARNTLVDWARKSDFVIASETSKCRIYRGSRGTATQLFVELAVSKDQMRIRAYFKAGIFIRLCCLFLIPEKLTLCSSAFIGHFVREQGASVIEPLFERLSLTPVREQTAKSREYGSLLFFCAGLLLLSYVIWTAIFRGSIQGKFPEETFYFNPNQLQWITKWYLGIIGFACLVAYTWVAKSTSSRSVKAVSILGLSSVFLYLGILFYGSGTRHVILLNSVSFHCSIDAASDSCSEAKDGFRKFSQNLPPTDQTLKVVRDQTAQYPKLPSARLIEALIGSVPYR